METSVSKDIFCIDLTATYDFCIAVRLTNVLIDKYFDFLHLRNTSWFWIWKKKKIRKTFQLRGDTHMTSMRVEWGKDVQGQGGGKILDVDGQGLRILENYTILMDVICVSSIMIFKHMIARTYKRKCNNSSMLKSSRHLR